MKIKLKEDYDSANLKENLVEVVGIKLTSGCKSGILIGVKLNSTSKNQTMMEVHYLDSGWFDDDSFPFPETSVVFLPVIMED